MDQLLAANDRFVHFVSAHRTLTYASVALVCVVSLALVRFLSARRNRKITLNFDLGAPISTSIAPAPVTPITHGRTPRCTHCGVSMPTRDHFCPSCGYAQPMKQIGTSLRM